jgi:hypothetical protein
MWIKQGLLYMPIFHIIQAPYDKVSYLDKGEEALRRSFLSP